MLSIIDDVARAYFTYDVGDGVEQTLCVDTGKFDGGRTRNVLLLGRLNLFLLFLGDNADKVGEHTFLLRFFEGCRVNLHVGSQPTANLCTGLCRGYPIEPFLGYHLLVGCDNLDLLTIFKCCVERFQLVVDASSFGMDAYVGVD